MQGTYRDERTVRDTPSFRTSSPNMLVAWLGLAFVRWTKFCYFLTYVQSILFWIYLPADARHLASPNSTFCQRAVSLLLRGAKK